jgi:hypothetical protein
VISRRVAAIALAALLLGGAGVAAAISRDDGDADDAAAPVTTSTLLLPETSTTAAPTSTAGVTSTTAGTATTTTAVRPTTTTRPATSTTSTTTGDCTSAQIQVTATTDRTTYSAGQQVKVDSTLRNRSQTTCFYAGHTFQVTIQDAVGRPIITFEVVTPAERSTFVPGATLTGSVPWDQRSCQTQPCPQPPPGPYSAAVKWTFAGGPYETRAAFSLTP